MIDLNNPQEIAEYIRNNIDAHQQFVLATIGDDRPWAVCLNLTYDENFNIIWKSEKNTIHSQHVRQNPNVAICIFSEDAEKGDFGLYISAIAHEVGDKEELESLIDIRFTRKGKPTPPLENFMGDGSSRIYYAQTNEMYFNDSRHAKTKVDLEILRKVFGKT